MFWLALVILFTFGASFACSLFEGLILSTTVAEVEGLKKTSPARGERLEALKINLEATISAILTLNTIANSCGSVLIGAICAHFFGERVLLVLTLCFGTLLLVGAEVLPKNLGVAQRKRLQPYVVYPLWWLCRFLQPITWLCHKLVFRLLPPKAEATRSDQEILLLAEKGAMEGTLSASESSIIANALALDDVRVSSIMTPRTVLTLLRKNSTVAEVFREYPNIPFARMPVFGRNVDDIVGLVRRRDLLKAKAAGLDADPLERHLHEVHFIPETVTVANALQVFMKTHQQLLVVVDEFGAIAGVLSMEDVMEQLLGSEIFEKDDMAVDMRELARARLRTQLRARSRVPLPKK